MILQKRFSREVKGVKYVKWVVTLPPKAIEMLGWKQGEILGGYIKGGKGGELIIVAKQQRLPLPKNYVEVTNPSKEKIGETEQKSD